MKQERLDEHDPNKILECDGYGIIPSDNMFVGISAGQRGALLTKVPFTKDASGRIFQRMLSKLGFSQSDEYSLNPILHNCYITNLVKSRILTDEGLNRLPTQEEIEYWMPYFEKEVEKVKPVKIIALGYLVFNALSNKYPQQIRVVNHPRWYQAHGALAPDSAAFIRMVREYRQVLEI